MKNQVKITKQTKPEDRDYEDDAFRLASAAGTVLSVIRQGYSNIGETQFTESAASYGARLEHVSDLFSTLNIAARELEKALEEFNEGILEAARAFHAWARGVPIQVP